MTKRTEVIGVYNNRADLLDKVGELKEQGVSPDHIYVVMKDEDRLSLLRSQTDAEVKTTEENWMEKFKNFFTGDDEENPVFNRLDLTTAEKQKYEQRVENGGMLLYVDNEEISDFLTPGATHKRTQKNETYDYDTAAMKESNRKPNPAKTNDFDEDLFAAPTAEREKMELREERLQVDKHEVPRGEVSLEKDVVEDKKSIDIPVSREEVHVERRPVTDAENDARDVSMEDDKESIRIPVTEERLDVKKEPVVKEEVVIEKKQKQDIETVEDTVKREEAHLEEEGDPEVKERFTDDHKDNL